MTSASNRSRNAFRASTFLLSVLVSLGMQPSNCGLIASTHFGSKHRIGITEFPRGGEINTTDATPKKKVLKLPRFLHFFMKKETFMKEKYELNLKEQIRVLEASIRRAKEEMRQLRSQLILANSKNIRQIASDVQEIKTLQHALEEEREKFRSEIEKLLLIIEELEKTREDLLQALEAEKKLKMEREALLEKEKLRVSATEQQAKDQLEALKKTLLEDSRKKIQSLEMELKQQSRADIQSLEAKWKQKVTMDESEKVKEYEKKLVDERRRAEEAIDKEKRQFQGKILKLETEWRQKLQVEESQKAKEFEQKLEEERRKGEEAVEKEKAKMRKLVKALAEREERETEKNSLIRNTLAGSSSSLSPPAGGKDSSRIMAAWNQLNKSSSVRSVTNSKSR